MTRFTLLNLADHAAMKFYANLMSILCFTLALWIGLPLKAENIRDPIAWFLVHYGHEVDDNLIYIVTDLDHDGHADYLMAYRSDVDKATHECPWTVFLFRDGHYVEAGEKGKTDVPGSGVLQFDLDHFFIGFIPELKEYGILSVLLSKSGESQLIAYTFSGNDFEKREVGNRKSEEERPAVEERFRKASDRSTGKPPIEEHKISN